MPILIRITTVPVSLRLLLKGQMNFMKQRGFQVQMISSDGAGIKELEEQEQCTHIIVPFTRTISPLQDFLCLLKLVRLLRKLKPDIVHTHTPKAGLLGMWAAGLAGVPVRLHTIAGLPWMETKGMMRRLLKLMEKLTAMPAHAVYPNSFSMMGFLQEQGIARGKMKVLGNGSSNGIDCDFFSVGSTIATEAERLRINESIDRNAWIWIFVGRVVKDKGVGELLEAFRLLQKDFPSDRLWIVGNEEPDLDPLDQVHSDILHSDPAIRFWGFTEDIRPHLAAAQVLVFPSYREGFPNVPMQAGAMGCMLLLSNINGCNEIVEHEVNGLLVPPKSMQQLAAAMKEIRVDPGKRDQYAVAIRDKITALYDRKKIWEILLQEYNSWLLKKGRIKVS